MVARSRSDHPAVDEVLGALAAHGYHADEGLATAIHLALTLRRPLLLEGDAGTGKTEVAKTVARWRDRDLIRLQCYEGIDAQQAIYDWDYARQLLQIRAAEVAGRSVAVNELYSSAFLVRRPLLAAIDHGDAPAPVLLIDEIDRADDEFEAYLLEVLSDFSITVPELGTFATDDPPAVVITSNRTRDLHDALKRRCVYHWVEHPDIERETAIIRERAGIEVALARQVASTVARMRSVGLYKPPGVAESIDWARAVAALGRSDLDEWTVRVTLGHVVKYKEDEDRLEEIGLADFMRSATGA